MPEPQPERVRVGDVELAYLEVGVGEPVLLFHGFPDVATTFLPLAERLGAAGFRCIAPWLRGYWPSSAGRHYDVGSLVGDALGLMDALGLDSARVVGHDWGADVAYGLCAVRPERTSAAVVLAVPHSAALGPNRLASFEQLQRSFHMWMFQLPGLAEQVVEANDFDFLRRLWADWSPGWDAPSSHLEEVLDCFRHDGVPTAALSYYRAVFDKTLSDPALEDVRSAAARPIEVPTLLLLGERDRCIALEMAAGAERAFRAEYAACTLPSCGHFPHLERPDEVAELAIDRFRGVDP
jgi:pimeloyl-ACP methyl ester carboxylesterase